MSSSQPSVRARFYQDHIVPKILGPMGAHLVEAAEPRPGERVLDIACGTGAVTRKAARAVGASGVVTGMDFGAHMMHVGRTVPQERGATIRWVQGDATALPFADSAFGLVLCAQGLMFFPDRVQALRDACRVVVPGGRLALAVWSTPEHNPYFRAMYEGLQPHIDEETAMTMRLPFALADPTDLQSLFSEAGLSDVRIETVSEALRLPPLEQFIPRHMSAMSVAAALASLGSDVVNALIRDVQSTLHPYEDPEGLRVPFQINIALAHRPT